MRTSWRRLPAKGNKLTSWKEAYRSSDVGNKTNPELTCQVYCLYEDIPSGEGPTPQAAKDDFLENIRFKITELTEMLEYCAKNEPAKQ